MRYLSKSSLSMLFVGLLGDYSLLFYRKANVYVKEMFSFLKKLFTNR